MKSKAIWEEDESLRWLALRRTAEYLQFTFLIGYSAARPPDRPPKLASSISATPYCYLTFLCSCHALLAIYIFMYLLKKKVYRLFLGNGSPYDVP